jgi:nucleotide-binding universal stress UspA family protein
MIKRILVGLSGSRFTRASVETAVELATRHRAELTGVTDFDIERLANIGPVPLGAGAEAMRLREQRFEQTEQHINDAIALFRDACAAAGLVHHVIRETGRPFEQLVALWRYHDLTILGLRGLFEYGVLESPDDEVIRILHKGVRPILATSDVVRPVRRVLVAYNGSMEAAKAMKRFVQLRLWDDIALHLVCFDRDADAARLLLRDAATYCRLHGFDARMHVESGPPDTGLPAIAAGLGADLIVMGSSSRGNLMRLILGDTAATMVRRSTLPLFITE